MYVKMFVTAMQSSSALQSEGPVHEARVQQLSSQIELVPPQAHAFFVSEREQTLWKCTVSSGNAHVFSKQGRGIVAHRALLISRRDRGLRQVAHRPERGAVGVALDAEDPQVVVVVPEASEDDGSDRRVDAGSDLG